MRLNLRVIVLAALVALPLAASGTASAQRVNYVSQTASGVSVNYFDLPVVTQLMFVSQVSGDTFVPALPLMSGSGSVTIPFAILPNGAGQYHVLAKQADKWIAQSVMFYTLILPPCPEC
jgi:hypothetical protein